MLVAVVSFGSDVRIFSFEVIGRSAARKVVEKANRRRGGLLLARRGSLAYLGLFRLRLRLRGHAAGGVPAGPQYLRRAARNHAGVLRLRDLLFAAPRGVVRALQVLQAIRAWQGLLHHAPERRPVIH